MVTIREHVYRRTEPRSEFEFSTDAQGLEEALRRKVKGEVRFDNGSRGLYATDASNYRQVPIGVVIPRDKEDVVETVAACRRFGAPVLSRGGGTSLAGQCCNVAVVIDFSKYMNTIVEIDPDRKVARVLPGIILDDLRDAAEKHNLTFGPDPATHSRCTLGGMIGNNSCGVHALMAGKTDDNVQELEVLTYDGLRMRVGKTSDEELERIVREGGRRAAIYSRLKEFRDRYADQIRQRFPDIPRRVSGYNLPDLLPEKGFQVARALVGSEATCVTVLEATLRLVYSPPARTLVVLGYPDIYTACDHVPDILTHKPIGLEGFDGGLVDALKIKGLETKDIHLLPDGRGWLLVEFGGDKKEESDGKAHDLMEALKKKSHPPNIKLYQDKLQTSAVWKVRESALGATSDVPGRRASWPGWEDSAVAPDKFGGYLRDLRKLMDGYGYYGDFYGHFGQGCLHVRLDFDFVTPDGIAKYRSFIDEAADLVLGYGGSLSGEHGDGQARAALLPKMFGEEMVRAFGEFKAIWDPGNKMNPGKIVAPYSPSDNLRLGVHYDPPNPATHFRFPDDHYSFSRATLRCVGVGECRRLDHGTMCPSFMVTREEKHSTRGRAHLLFEMMQGNPVDGGWRDENVREALDLCLACKGCKGDCPVNVDMATYKAEFLSHYYAGRLRPITAYSMGQIHLWARLASRNPRLVNFFTQTPPFSTLFKLLGGIAPKRRIPRFADRSFKSRLSVVGSRLSVTKEPTTDYRLPTTDRQRVILWPDTFNNYFKPETLQAAVEVLEAAGCEVTVPRGNLCCGRPLYDWGMLNQAKHLLRQILDTLHDAIVAGTPVVVLEPSCAAVFRDELLNLFPHNTNAVRLARQTLLLSEFLQQKVPGYKPPRLEKKALVHGHCHHKSLMRMGDEQAVLSGAGLDHKVLDSGCCGMAGAFGFERGEHYDVSIKAGERVLLPAVRAASKDTLIIADGFSCREQIEQCTERHTLHLAEVLQMGLRTG